MGLRCKIDDHIRFFFLPYTAQLAETADKIHSPALARLFLRYLTENPFDIRGKLIFPFSFILSYHSNLYSLVFQILGQIDQHSFGATLTKGADKKSDMDFFGRYCFILLSVQYTTP